MKKLMTAAAIVCAAVMANAATVTWSQTNGAIYDGTGTGTALTDGTTVYLINATYTQSAFAAAFDAAEGDMTATLTAVGSNLLGTGETVMDGYIDSTEATTTSAAVSAYYVVFGDGKAYISTSEAATVNPLDTTLSTIEFGGPDGSDSIVAAKSFSSADTWVSASAAPTPEPTSGLLLLIGLAGLALKRRRA